LVDLSADAVDHLGAHLKQISDIMAISVNPSNKGSKTTAQRLNEKLEMYKKYCAEVQRRKEAIDGKIHDDFERLRLWRLEAGTEGASMVEELQKQYDTIRVLKLDIERLEEELEGEKEKVANLIELGERKDAKIVSLREIIIEKKFIWKDERVQRALVCSWLGVTFEDVKFKFKAQQEAERLKLEHQKKMRKAACEARIKVIQIERERRLLQVVFLAFQEESVVCEMERQLFQLREKHDDEILILHAQLAQALGDEERAKELVAEQVKRMEDARRAQREAERREKEAIRAMRKALEEKEQAEKERDAAVAGQLQAEKERDQAIIDKELAEKREAEQRELAIAADLARAKAEKEKREAEELVKKTKRKVQNLQRMIAELGAESDSDAPPDERPPAFFVNEDGSKVPRPRTRKERMNMAYREAESARFELRLGMAAMIDKDLKNQQANLKLMRDLMVSQKEVSEVRWANKTLTVDLQEAVAKYLEAQDHAAAAAALRLEDPWHMNPNPEAPLASSAAAASRFSPRRPVFEPGASSRSLGDGEQFLVKTASQPILMPDIHGDGSPAASPEKITLAPLRKLKRPADWRVTWK